MLRISITFCILILSKISLAQNSNPLLEKFCRTWISFERTLYVPMEHRQFNYSISENDRDSLLITNSGNFFRYNKTILYHGSWHFNIDSTSIIVDSRRAFVGYSR